MKKLPTFDQFKAFRGLAIKNGLGRKEIETLTKEGTLNRFFKAIKNGDPVTFGPPQPIPPLGAQIHPLSVEIDGVREKLILLNFALVDGSWEKAKAWGRKYKLGLTGESHIYAISRQYPNFDKEIGYNPVNIVATKEELQDGRFFAPCIWRCDERKGSYLLSTHFCSSHDCWFAFLYPAQQELYF
jgi:hypothetical protein